MDFYEFVLTYYEPADDDFLKVSGVTSGRNYAEAMEYLIETYGEENLVNIHHFYKVEYASVYQFNAEDTKFNIKASLDGAVL